MECGVGDEIKIRGSESMWIWFFWDEREKGEEGRGGLDNFLLLNFKLKKNQNKYKKCKKRN